MSKISVIVNDFVNDLWTAEHGLALAVDFMETRFLIDTGAGNALIPNLVRFGIDPASLEFIILSHGHNDHTGGIPALAAVLPHPIPVWFGAGLTADRCSFSPPVTQSALCCEKADTAPERGEPRNISMPSEAVQILRHLPPSYRNEIQQWSKVQNGIFLTGEIPRRSGETTGGAFYLDSEGTKPDLIRDELGILLVEENNGTLIHGCCHSGILNTLSYCAEMLPNIQIKTVIGGLHLVRADTARLAVTAAQLNASSVERLVLLHCTGDRAAEYLKNEFSGKVEAARGGDCISF